jgi:CubicO group peptidase (beta-lactamase class C family)
MKITRFLVGAALLLIGATASAAELSDLQRSALDSLAKQTSEGLHLPSFVILIDQGGKTVYASTTGSADLEHGVAASLDTPYGIGSITKSFTALAVLQLVDEGKLRLDNRLPQLLPGYDGPAKNVTLQQLLNHTSGIPNYTGEIPGIREGLKRSPYERKQMLDFFRSAPLLFKPGSKFSYTNSGYYLLGLIIEAATGRNYYDHLSDRVFKPLGLSRTYGGDDSQIIAGRARGYDLGKDGFTNASPWYYLVPFSAGSLVSTAGDLVTYRRGVFRSEAFSPRLRTLVVQTPSLSGGEPNAYALGGLIVSGFHGHRKISHDGDIWGYTSTHAYYPDDDLTVVILTNRQVETPAISSIEARIARVQAEGLDLWRRDSERNAGDPGLDG